MHKHTSDERETKGKGNNEHNPKHLILQLNQKFLKGLETPNTHIKGCERQPYYSKQMIRATYQDRNLQRQTERLINAAHPPK